MRPIMRMQVYRKRVHNTITSYPWHIYKLDTVYSFSFQILSSSHIPLYKIKYFITIDYIELNFKISNVYKMS